MSEFSKSFLEAFTFAMKHEVGPKFDINDPDVILGKCETAAQKKKVGYVNIKEDRGGETKFGISKNGNPDLEIKNITLADAMKVYHDRYWEPMKCENFQFPLSFNLFDAAINHGNSVAAKMLQRAVGISPATGFIGDLTIAATNKLHAFTVCDKILQSRENLFNAIVNKNPSQKKFLKGWMARLESIRTHLKELE